MHAMRIHKNALGNKTLPRLAAHVLSHIMQRLQSAVLHMPKLSLAHYKTQTNRSNRNTSGPMHKWCAGTTFSIFQRNLVSANSWFNDARCNSHNAHMTRIAALQHPGRHSSHKHHYWTASAAHTRTVCCQAQGTGLTMAGLFWGWGVRREGDWCQSSGASQPLMRHQNTPPYPPLVLPSQSY